MHTPTPWKVDNYSQILSDPITGVYETIATTPKAWIDNKLFNHDHQDSAAEMLRLWSERAQANASFIVNAVNSHDALVEALRLAHQVLEQEYNLQPDDYNNDEFDKVMNTITNALALAEKG